MARPKKTQETAPRIVEKDQVVLTIRDEDDDVPVFEEDEEQFNEHDLEEITEIAAKIVGETREAVSKTAQSAVRTDNNLAEVMRALDALTKSFTALSNKVDSLVMRDDPSKILYTLDEVIEEKFSTLLSSIESVGSLTAPVYPAPPKLTASRDLDEILSKAPPKEVVDKIRKWVGTIPSGKSASLDTVTVEIGKRLGMDPRLVHGVIQSQEDIVKISNGKIYSL
jgi:hypothetical protein